MQNRIGFIPKSFVIAPDYYKQIGRNWIAVFLTIDGREYHIELNTLGFWNPQNADKVEILKQEYDCRRRPFIDSEFTSIRAAYNRLLPILQEGIRYVPYGINGQYFVYDNYLHNIPVGYGSKYGNKHEIQIVCNGLNKDKIKQKRLQKT